MYLKFQLVCNVLNIFMFIIHVDLNSMTITSIESSILLPITTVHCLTSELFTFYGVGISILFSLSLYFLFSL
jgi:hypothetical protein